MDRPSTSQVCYMDFTCDEEETVDDITLKTRYMLLLEEVNALEKEKICKSINGVKSVLVEANKLLPQVKNTCNLYWDAQVLDSATAALEEITNNVDVGEGNFNLIAFADQMKSKSLDNEGNPTFLLLAANAKLAILSNNMIPSWTPLLGSFEHSDSQKLRKEKRRFQRDKLADKKEPEKLSKVDKTQSGVEEIVQNIYAKLRRLYRDNGKQPIHFYKFVVNPDSFSATVENLFHISFLVNDGHVRLNLDDDGSPLISPVSKGKENSNPESNFGSNEIKQNILYMDMESWQVLVAGMKLSEAMI